MSVHRTISKRFVFGVVTEHELRGHIQDDAVADTQ
jgi:hypothetical protein